jgi:flagellar biosynthesis chaperone FliJ
MTGKEFKLIRLFNRITQEELRIKLNKKNRWHIYRIEKSDNIPERFVNVLSKEIQVDLSNTENLKKSYDLAYKDWLAKQKKKLENETPFKNENLYGF